VKILCLGDSPFQKTGFGVVNDVATKSLFAAGHDLIVLGGQDYIERPDAPYVFVPAQMRNDDIMGFHQVDGVIEQHRPDAVHIIGDPASITLWFLSDLVGTLPVVAYMPVEGEPLNIRWTLTWREKAKAGVTFISCTEYGQNVLSEAGFGSWMAYHGVSDDFGPVDTDYREAMRKAVGWDDKFVVMNVAQNVRRKQWPRLFEAIAILSKRNPDIILYAHTVPFNNHFLGGHDLGQLAHHMGIADRVVFPKSHTHHNAAVPLRGFKEPGLVDLYNMADVFVLPSQMEGFGLPLAEAMKCGTPVITTDMPVHAEVVGKAGVVIPPHDYEWFQGGQRYANLDPKDIASAIERLKKSPELRKQMGRKGIERAKAFTWATYEQTLRERFDAIALSLQG
jgi:glycosyltransferase involved in cell wall biosynthesis